MTEKIREQLCDPLKCFTAFMIVNCFLFSLCAAGYWNLDSKMDKVSYNLREEIHQTTAWEGGVAYTSNK